MTMFRPLKFQVRLPKLPLRDHGAVLTTTINKSNGAMYVRVMLALSP